MVATSRKKATGSQAAPCKPRRTSRAISAPVIAPSSSCATRRRAADGWRPGPRRRRAMGGDGRDRAARRHRGRGRSAARRAATAARRGHHPRQPRALGLAGRQQADRHVGQLVEAECRHCLGQTAALSRRPARAAAAARGRAPELSSASAHRPRSIRPAAGRSSPATSRIRLDLPLPLGPVTCSASPGAELEVEPLEQQPPAADQASPRR